MLLSQSPPWRLQQQAEDISALAGDLVDLDAAQARVLAEEAALLQAHSLLTRADVHQLRRLVAEEERLQRRDARDDVELLGISRIHAGEQEALTRAVVDVTNKEGSQPSPTAASPKETRLDCTTPAEQLALFGDVA